MRSSRTLVLRWAIYTFGASTMCACGSGMSSGTGDLARGGDGSATAPEANPAIDAGSPQTDAADAAAASMDAPWMSSGDGLSQAPAACPSADDVAMQLDGRAIPDVHVASDPGTPFAVVWGAYFASPSDTWDVALNLTPLAAGVSTVPSGTKLRYRKYPPSDGGAHPPLVIADYTTFSGSVEVVHVAAMPDDVTCGSYDVTASAPAIGLGSNAPATVHVAGHFRASLLGPQPGGR
jgi:hypothetical protein